VGYELALRNFVVRLAPFTLLAADAAGTGELPLNGSNSAGGANGAVGSSGSSSSGSGGSTGSETAGQAEPEAQPQAAPAPAGRKAVRGVPLSCLLAVLLDHISANLLDLHTLADAFRWAALARYCV